MIFILAILVPDKDVPSVGFLKQVVAVNILVFEINLQQNSCSSKSQVDIPIAGFVLGKLLYGLKCLVSISTRRFEP